VRVEFVRKLRDEMKFDSASALVEQMERDATRARHVLRRARV
jgi:FAD synthase